MAKDIQWSSGIVNSGVNFATSLQSFKTLMGDSYNWNKNQRWAETDTIYGYVDPTKNGMTMLGTTISQYNYQFDSDKNFLGFNTGVLADGIKINLRYFLSYTTSSSTLHCNKIYRWTNLDDFEEKYKIIFTDTNYNEENILGNQEYFSLNGDYTPKLYSRYTSPTSYLIDSIERDKIFLDVDLLFYDEDGSIIYGSSLDIGDKFKPNVDNKLWNSGILELNNKTYRLVSYNMSPFIWDNSSYFIYRNFLRDNNSFANNDIYSFGLTILSEITFNGNTYYLLNGGLNDWVFNVKDSSSLTFNTTDFATGTGFLLFNGNENQINFFTFNKTGNNNVREEDIKFNELNKYYYYNDIIYKCDKPYLSNGRLIQAGVVTPLKQIYHALACTLIPFGIRDKKIGIDYINKEKYGDRSYIGIRRESDGVLEGDFIPYVWGETKPETEFRPENFKPYDPSEDIPPEPVTPDDDGDINIGSVPLSITDAFTNCYVLNTSTVNYIGKNLWNGLGSQQAESGLTFGGMIKNFFGLFTDVKSETTDSTYRELALNTVLDYFVSLRYYPIPTLFSLTQAIATHNFSVGTGQEPMTIQDASGFGRPLNRIVRMSGGQLTRAELNASGKVYNSFLDYQPNTTATLYIPYCGTVELTPSQLLDCDTIDIVYALDIMTGALSAIAMKNGTANYPLAMLQGTCGFETLVSGSNKGIVELATSISNLRFGANTSNQIVQGLAGSAIGSASQNAENTEVNTQAMLIRGIASAYNAGTNMYNYLVGLPTMTGISPISAGSMSSLASTIMPQTAYIQLTKHSADIPTNFENTYGRTTNVYGSIGSYQGYLICGNPRLEGIPCTEHERDEIFSLLTTGVYVE